jgi:hypothetical protein
MSWWNKRQNIEPIKIQPTLGTKLTKAYKKKLRQKKNGKRK